MAAVAAVIELGVPGSLPTDYAVVAVVVNLAVLAWWRVAGRRAWRWAGTAGGWSAATVVSGRWRSGSTGWVTCISPWI